MSLLNDLLERVSEDLQRYVRGGGVRVAEGEESFLDPERRGPIYRFLDEELGVDPLNITPEEVDEAVRQAAREDRISDRRVRELLDALEADDALDNETMSGVTYDEWVSIAFQIAKEKGFVSGQENNRDLVSLAAEIWNERKTEISASRSAAKRIAREEISVA